MEQSFYHQYAMAEAEHWWFQGRRAIIRDLMRRWLPEQTERKILDVGCGPGGMLDLLTEFGEVHAIDSSEDALSYCRERLGERARLHQGTVPEGLPGGISFDVVTAFDVIEHIRDGVAGLRGIRETLKPGGLLFCTVPAFKFLWSVHDDINHHFRRYTRSTLGKQLVDAGYRVDYLSYFNMCLFPPIAAVRMAGRLLPLKGELESDLSSPPSVVNQLLTSVFSVERHLLRFTPLPFGVSLLAIASPAGDKVLSNT